MIYLNVGNVMTSLNDFFGVFKRMDQIREDLLVAQHPITKSQIKDYSPLQNVQGCVS